jgi:hypothetical protein
MSCDILQPNIIHRSIAAHLVKYATRSSKHLLMMLPAVSPSEQEGVLLLCCMLARIFSSRCSSAGNTCSHTHSPVMGVVAPTCARRLEP